MTTSEHGLGSFARRGFDIRCRSCAAGSHRFAYTLLELMIVLAILTVVMIVAWPRITGRLQLVGPREAALQLKSDCAEAREHAIRTGEAWAVRIERGSARYEIGPVQAFLDRDEVLAASIHGTAVSVDTMQLESPSLESSNVRSQSKLKNGKDLDADSLLEPAGRESEIWRRELAVGMLFEDGFAHQAYESNVVRGPPTDAGWGAPAQQLQSQPQVLDPRQAQLPGQHEQPLPNHVQIPLTAPDNPMGQIHHHDNWKFVVIYQPDGRATDSEIRLKEEVTDSRIRLRIRGFTGATTIGDVERRTYDPNHQLDRSQPVDEFQNIQEQQQNLKQQASGRQLQDLGRAAPATELQP